MRVGTIIEKNGSIITGQFSEKMDKNIKIGLVEPALHVEVLRNYALIFSSLNVEVHMVLTSSANELMDSLPNKSNIHKYYLDKDFDLLDALSQCTIIIFTTFNRKISPFLDIPVPKYAVIHAFHQHFDPWRNFDFYIRHLYSLWNLFRSIISNAPSLETMDGFIAGAPTVFEYLKRQSYFHRYQFYDFPFYINESSKSTNILKNDSFRMVIPGSIHPANRNYQMIYTILKTLKNPDRIVEIYLAGKPSGRAGIEIIKKMKALKQENIQIKSFDNYLRADIYKQIIEEADILLCPIPPKIVSGFTVEKNSYSHVSGNINDFVNNGKAVILPSHYQLESGLEPAVLRYQNQDDLKVLIENLMSGFQSIPDTSDIFVPFALKARMNHFRQELDRLLNP